MRTGSTRVVLLFPGALGDLLLVLPTLRHVRAQHSTAEVVLAVDRRWFGLASRLGVADRLVAVDGVDLATTLGGGPAPSWWGHADSLYAWFGRADAETLGALARHAGWSHFGAVVRAPGAVHAAQEYAGALGWHPTWDQLVAGSRMSSDRAAFRTTVPDAPTLAMHRGAGSPAKRWGARGFARIATEWLGWGGRVVDLRGPADADLPALEGAETAMPSVGDLPGLLAGATCFVGNDSGPAHLAGVMGIAGAVIFGPTRACRWRPLSNDLVPFEGVGGEANPFAGVDVDAVHDTLQRTLTRERP